jgi:hypothetical protein
VFRIHPALIHHESARGRDSSHLHPGGRPVFGRAGA